MKGLLRVSLVLIFILVSISTKAQLEIRIGETITCGLESEKDSHNNITNINGIDRARKQEKNDEPIFDVKYTGFTEEARVAFQYAVDIWEDMLDSDVKIKVFANWAFIENINTLAFVTPTEVKNFKDAPIKNLWYPVALAEKISGNDINPTTEADIVATFNNRRTDWYFGLDGNCPSNKLDLVTIVLHELGHGLGFSGTFRVSNSTGFVGLNDGLPKVYDTYLRNGTNQMLLDFPNNSTALASQIISNNVVFVSPVARVVASSANPRVFAPSPYAPGSSISHLDQETYENTPNSLMTPFASHGKVAHNVGPLIKGIFYEMGWLHTKISHQLVRDTEVFNKDLLSFTVASDTTYQSETAMLHASINGAPIVEYPMSLVSPGEFEVITFSVMPESEIEYYFTIKDVFNRTYRFPIINEENLSFYYGEDVVSPVITHTQSIIEIVEFEESITLSARVTDNIGIERVYLEYWINDGDHYQQDMMISQGDNYTTTIDLTTLDINQGDDIHYKIVAIDNSTKKNTVSSSLNGAIIKVKSFSAIQMYGSNLNTDGKEFYGDFSIKTITGFVNGAIHSVHPYPKTSSGYADLIYNFLSPVIIKNEDSFIEFDEVVLIDPSINPSLSSNSDYVVVEGSLNLESWIPLIDPYTSQDNTDWLTYYNSNMLGGDSRAIGTLNYYKKRRINLLSVFESGDVIYLRFRLRYNDTKNGWGWAIDNLKIQNIIVGLDKEILKNSHVYPNPVTTTLNFEINESGYVRVEIMDFQGRILRRGQLDESREMDVTDLPNGTYLVKIIYKDQIFTFRIVKIPG